MDFDEICGPMDFLNSKESESPLFQKSFKENPKENFFIKIRDYFTGNSNIWYSYEYDEKTDDIKYSFPRTFIGDLRLLKDYLTNLFDKK